MSITLQQNIHFGLGFSSLPDAFQSGREAAQMAKRQMPEGSVDMVIVLGPDSAHFQDFIEGVRLITGEDQLIGLPAKRIYSTETSATDLYTVILMRSDATHLALTFTNIPNNNSNLAITALIHQLRQIRGNASYEEPHGGLLIVNRLEGEAQTKFVEKLSMEAGFKSDIICLTPQISSESVFTVRSRTIGAGGLVALEYLSPFRWGMGSVDIKAFGHKSGLTADAVKSAVRDALAQLKGHQPVAGYVFFDAALDTSPEESRAAMNAAATLLPHTPLIGIPTSQQFLRTSGRSTVAQPESIICVLVPK